MKKNVFVLVLVMVVGAFAGNLAFANESKKELSTKREIILKGKMGKVAEEPILLTRKTSRLSIDLVTAFVEDGVVTVYFNQAIGDDYVSILISNESEGVLFEMSVIVDQAMEVVIPIEVDDFNEYVLEIYSSEIELEGEF